MAVKLYTPLLKPVQIDTTTGGISAIADINNAPPGPNNTYGISIVLQTPGGIIPTADLAAERVWNAVWNDYADFQLLNDELIPGKCYIDTADGAKICTERCQLSVIGLATDTFAQVVGTRNDQHQVPIAVAGWALAHVDQEYPCGTPLTNDESGNLAEMSLEEKRDYPERLVAIYKRKEQDSEFGPSGRKVPVNGRHWVKVK